MRGLAWAKVLSISALAVASTGCFMVPSSSEPLSWVDHNATFEPGFGTNEHQLARWTCPVTTPTEESSARAPTVTLVLVQHPKRGLLLHNVTDDLVMVPAEKIPGGGLRFISSVPAERNSYIVPPDYKEAIDREWSLGFEGYSIIITNKVKQPCPAGPPVRFL